MFNFLIPRWSQMSIISCDKGLHGTLVWQYSFWGLQKLESPLPQEPVRFWSSSSQGWVRQEATLSSSLGRPAHYIHPYYLKGMFLSYSVQRGCCCFPRPDTMVHARQFRSKLNGSPYITPTTIDIPMYHRPFVQRSVLLYHLNGALGGSVPGDGSELPLSSCVSAQDRCSTGSHHQ